MVFDGIHVSIYRGELSDYYEANDYSIFVAPVSNGVGLQSKETKDRAVRESANSV